MNAGSVIKLFRTASQVSQGDLAERLQITRTYLSLVESGKKQPSLALVRRLSEELKIPIYLLIGAGPGEDGEIQSQMTKLFGDLLSARIKQHDQSSQAGASPEAPPETEHQDP